MAASVQFRPQNRDLGMVMREVDEDLAIFLGIRNGEKDINDHLLVGDFDDSEGLEPNHDSLLNMNGSQTGIIAPSAAADDFLNLETETSDYNWLVMQPDSSLLPSVEVAVQDSAASQTEISNGEGISLKSEVEDIGEQSATPTDGSLQLTPTSTTTDSSAGSKRRPSLSGERKPTPRSATPTGRSSLPTKPRPSRASTPTSRSTLPSSKPVAANSRSSTPSSRPSIPSKSASRSSTPTTRKPATPKTGPTMSKNPLPSRGASPTVKSRPSDKPGDTMPHDKRPASASRGRPTGPLSRSSSCSGKLTRQKSCSPAKARVPIVSTKTGSGKMLSRSRGCGNDRDDVNPVLMGTKMVDRVVNMRKLAPPRQDDGVSHDNCKKSSNENSGFGRLLSKKSLDMAIRHMDIRRSIVDKLRPGAQPGLSSKSSKGGGASESSLTSSCDSSK